MNKFKAKEASPHELIKKNQTLGHEGMTAADVKWQSTFKAIEKSLVLTLAKKDLIEVLETSKMIESSNR